MKNFKCICVLLCLCTISCTLNAQGLNAILSEQDKQEFQQRIKDNVMEFQGYLSKIANDKNDLSVRNNAIRAALNLYIGKGKPYTSLDDWGNETNHDAVKMYTSSKYSKRLRPQPMSAYLENLKLLGEKYLIRVETADAVRVDNITPAAGGRYVAVAYFVQKYYRYTRDGQLIYVDETTKKVKVYIDPIQVGNGVVWKALLGDVYVVSTR